MAKITTVKKALEAVRENGRSLGDVSEKLKKAELCLEAVSA